MLTGVPGLVEAGKRPAGPHRDVGEVALPEPGLAAVDLDDSRTVVAEPGRHAVDPEVGRAALERVHSDDLFRNSPALDVLAAFVLADAGAAGRDVSMEDARVFAALAMVISLGWRLFGRTALVAAGLDGTRAESYGTRIRAHLADLAAGATQRPPAPVTTD
jgi:hypothetical protein